MKQFTLLVLFIVSTITIASAQTSDNDRDERKTELREKNDDRHANAKQKVDYNLFRRQMLTLKEYTDERKKIPALQKATKSPAKVIVYVDTAAEGDEKTLTGFIHEQAGDNSVNVYEITYDRAQKKIVAVKPTGETIDTEKEEASEKVTKEKTVRKKSKDDDDDEETDEEKPVKSKHKEKDKDED
jgi:hypothetical protein